MADDTVPARGPSRLVLALAAGGGALATCAVMAVVAGLRPELDAAAVHQCGMAIPALNDDGVTLDVGRTTRGPAPDTLHIDYIVKLPGGGARRRQVTCRFEKTDPDRTPRIAGIATEAGPLSDTSFYFLRRFYLEQPAEAGDGDGPQSPVGGGDPQRHGSEK